MKNFRFKNVLGVTSLASSRWWTVFSDVFLAGLIVIVLSGLVMMRGPKGLRGRGGVELIAGILIPLLFIFLT